MKSENIQWVRLVKGLAVLLVVIGHSIIPNIRSDSIIFKNIWDFIYIFHMPIFFILSGYLYQIKYSKYHKQGSQKFIKSKFTSLMLPYFSYSIISYIGINICFHINKLATLLTKAGYSSSSPLDSFYQIITYEGSMDKHLWFLYSLFIIFLINYLTKKLLQKKTGIFILSILWIVSFYIDTPYVIYKVLNNLIYFSLGRVMVSMCESEKSSKEWSFFQLVLFFTTSFSYLILENWLNSKDIVIVFIKYLMLFVSSIFGSVQIISLIKSIKNKKIINMLDMLGKNSFAIYLFHQPFIVSGTAGILYTVIGINPIFVCIISTIFGIILPILIRNVLIEKSRMLKYLFFGKKTSERF